MIVNSPFVGRFDPLGLALSKKRMANAIRRLLSLPTWDSTGKLIPGLWSDGRLSDILLPDNEGQLVAIDGDHLPYEGARWVENLLDATEDFNDSSWLVQTDGDGVVTVAPDGSYVDCAITSSGRAWLLKAFTATAGEERISATFTNIVGDFAVNNIRNNTATCQLTLPNGAIDGRYTTNVGATPDGALALRIGIGVNATESGGAKSIRIAFPQREDVTGKTNQNPSEYQLVDATHDGIATYNTANGNTVDANGVVTEAVGVPLECVRYTPSVFDLTLLPTFTVWKNEGTRTFSTNVSAVRLHEDVDADAVVYVDAATGLDTNPGTVEQPYQTLYKGLRENSGDKLTVYVASGTYVDAAGWNTAEIYAVDINVIATGGIVTSLQTVGTVNNGFIREGKRCYIEGVVFDGGATPFYYAGIAASGTEGRFKNCVFKNAVTGNGLYIRRNGLYILEGCSAIYNKMDGFNYHNADAVKSQLIIEINCTGSSNGVGGTANNGSTMHDEGSIVRINGSYIGNENRNIHDVSNSRSWNLGVTASDGLQANHGNFVVGINSSDASIMWLDTCTSSGATNKDLDYYNSDGVSQFYANDAAFSGGVVGDTALVNDVPQPPELAHYPATQNEFLNGDAPVTQSISLGTGDWTISVYGTGSVTSSAGTATGTGYGAATEGSDNHINITGAGTVTFTVAGSLNYVQVENKAFSTPPVVTEGAPMPRDAVAVRYPRAGSFEETQGTVMMRMRMGQDSKVETFAHGIMTTRNGSQAGFAYMATGSNGRFRSFDGTAVANTPAVTWSAGDEIIIVIAYADTREYFLRNVTQDGEWQHDSVSFDGAFHADGSNIEYFKSNSLSLHLTDHEILAAPLDNDAVEARYGVASAGLSLFGAAMESPLFGAALESPTFGE